MMSQPGLIVAYNKVLLCLKTDWFVLCIIISFYHDGYPH